MHKKALTCEEIEAERCEEDEEMKQADHTESDDEQQRICNPLNWSMACDGKPIEYWSGIQV